MELKDGMIPPGVKGGISDEPVEIDSDRELHNDGVVGDWVLNWPLFDVDMACGIDGTGVVVAR